MKNLIYLLSSCILFSSCYSYKTVDLSKNKLILTEKYKIKTATSKKIKGRIAKFNDNTLVLIKNKIKTEILLSEIQSIKKRKFSYLKTIGFPILLLGLSIWGYGESSFGVDIGTIQFPN